MLLPAKLDPEQVRKLLAEGRELRGEVDKKIAEMRRNDPLRQEVERLRGRIAELERRLALLSTTTGDCYHGEKDE